MGSDSEFWGGDERVCEWGARMPHPARSGIWIWIQQIPSVNFEENVISNGHFESILFNEGVSISWLFYLEHNLFFCWESRNIEQWKRLTWDSTLWLANKLNHFYEIIFIGSKPFIINHSHGIYDFWTCIRWQLKSRRTQVEVIFLENTTISAAIVWNNAVCLLVFGLYRALYNFCSS